jgi:hypothetical protein
MTLPRERIIRQFVAKQMLEPELHTMFFSNSPKHRMLLGIVGPSAAFGGFLMMAILLFDKPYSSVELRLMSLGCYLLLAGMSLNLAIQACRKVLKALP